MSAADAIRRAQAWREHDCRYVMPGKCELCDNLAAIGPASVALAAAVQELLRGMSEEAQDIFFGVERARELRDSLAQWTEACGEHP